MVTFMSLFCSEWATFTCFLLNIFNQEVSLIVISKKETEKRSKFAGRMIRVGKGRQRKELSCKSDGDKWARIATPNGWNLSVCHGGYWFYFKQKRDRVAFLMHCMD
jgi:hypothetical protein